MGTHQEVGKDLLSTGIRCFLSWQMTLSRSRCY